MRKNETHKPHQSLIRSSSSSKEEEEDNKNTRQQREEETTRTWQREKKTLLILPLMVLLSAELMVDCFWCVSRGVRGGVCYKKLSIFSQKRKKHTKIENVSGVLLIRWHWFSVRIHNLYSKFRISSELQLILEAARSPLFTKFKF